jgi:hypothetical protein
MKISKRGRHLAPRPRHGRSVIVLMAVAALVVTMLPVTSNASDPVTDAITTTFVDPAKCKQSRNAVNCTHYTEKTAVYLSGIPVNDARGLGDGTYYFTVIEPGGQNTAPFNELNPKNLSAAGGDLKANRTFSLSGGEIQAPGAPNHDFQADGLTGHPVISVGDPSHLYANTSNNGGVYIVAVCRVGATGSSQCKYDQFKVIGQDQEPQVNAVLSGKKYRDDNKNGQWDDDPAEPGLEGWEINLDCDEDALDATETTDADGHWSVTTPDADPMAGTVTCTVYETQQTGWRQTGNTVDQTTPSGGATACLASSCNPDPGALKYTVTFPLDEIAAVDGLNFGNIPQGTVTLVKYYDADLNGQRGDASAEPGIANWRITQAGAASAIRVTGIAGTAHFSLDPGTYTFTEVQASNWIQTGNTVNQSTTTGGATVCLGSACSPSVAAFSYLVVIPNDQPSTASNLAFGNVCLNGGGGLTLGFWSNKNGGAILSANNNAILNQVLALNLRKADGGRLGSVSLSALQKFLSQASATNMANMLSAQLAAMKANVVSGRVDGSALIYAPGTNGANALGFATVNDVMGEANTLLGTNGTAKLVILDGNPLRPRAEALKNALDGANNNRNFLQPSPATCPAPVFPSA